MIGGLLGKLFRGLLRPAAGSRGHERALIEAGLARQAAGACQEAEAFWRAALARSPRNGQASHLLGRSLGQRGVLDEAEEHLRRAAAALPDVAQVQQDLGNVLLLAQKWDEAERCYRLALAAEPASLSARCNLGTLLLRRERWADAAECLGEVLRADPAHPAALKSQVSALVRLGRGEEALASIAAAAAGGDKASLDAARGYVLLSLLRPDEALPLLRGAATVCPADAEIQGNMAIALQDLGRFDEAVEAYDRAIALHPDDRGARWHRSLALLLTGRFGEAWPDYELRLEQPEWRKRPFRYSRWDGGDISGRTVLVYAEQGLGDEIMFSSCLPDLMRCAGRCVLECSPRLAPIFARSFPGAMVHGAARDDTGKWLETLPEVDFQVPIGSLPLYFRRSLADFPAHHGYLAADQVRVARWRERLAALGDGAKFGISWRGGTERSRRALRSLDLADCGSLLGLKGVHWVSLQYGDCEADLERARTALAVNVHHWPEAIADYEETAALVTALDGVASVCTAVVHLGGALGRPVSVMAPLVPEWRYMARGSSMPWYPSVRVRRQSRRGEWDDVLEVVAQDLLSFRIGQ